MVPDSCSQVQLGLSQIDLAQVWAGLPSLALEGMAFYASFACQDLASLRRIIRKDLGIGKGP